MSVSLYDDGTLAAKGARYFFRGLQDMNSSAAQSVYIMSAERSYSAALHQSVMWALTNPSAYVIVILLCTRGRRDYSCLPRERVWYLDGSLPLEIFRQQLHQLTRHIVNGGELENAGPYRHMTGGRCSLKSRLSGKECIVLQYILKSYDLARIARCMGIKNKTVSSHKCSLMQKLNAGTLAELHHRLCMEGANTHDTVRVAFSQKYKGQNDVISSY